MDYTVKRGDNLSKIAKSNNTTVSEICAKNPGLNKDLIKAGQKIVLPLVSKNNQCTTDTFEKRTPDSPKQTKKIIKPVDKNDTKYKKGLEEILKLEGGFKSAEKDGSDLRTNKGITQETYNKYLKDKASDTSKTSFEKKDVKNISDEEVKEIYYNYYYLKSGADKISDKKTSFWTFDTAVNCGNKKAQQLYKECGTNNNKWKIKRDNYYKSIAENKPAKRKFLNGWLNRNNKVFNTTI